MIGRITAFLLAFVAGFALVSLAEAGWTENWDSYAEGEVPSGDWAVFGGIGPEVDESLNFPEISYPNTLDGSNLGHGIIFRAVDPNDNTLSFSWYRKQGNSVERTLEIGLYTSNDPNSARVTLFFDARDTEPTEHFDSIPGGGTYATGIGVNEDGWFDAVIQLLPGGTQARVAWRNNFVGGLYTQSTLPLPAGFAFNYVGIDKFGKSGGPAGPGSRLDDLAVFTAVPGDADFDGDVDGQDFLILQRDDPLQIPSWEANYPFPLAAVSAAVPEPATVVLFAIAALAPALSRRPRHVTHSST